MAEEFPFDISPMYEGERIRGKDFYVELGGPKNDGYELMQATSMDEVEDGKFTLIGPDIPEIEEGSKMAFAQIYKIAGELVEEELEGVMERRVHDFQNYIQGFMHLNQRYDIWCRISKDDVKKGVNSLKMIADATMMLFHNELPFIEKIEAIFVTDEAKIKEGMPEALEVYKKRDARTKGLHDEDVDTFYGCTLCQAFAPTNVCVVTPDRISLCGAISWADGRAAAKVDPEGPNFAIATGDCIDPIGGEYTGVNECAVDKSGGEFSKIKLHSFFEYPHTSCGCFEVIGFYVPEVDGIGWVDRDFPGTAPNGLTFANMAGQAGGGKQILGFLGVGVSYFSSPKFIQADGGWKRTVWMPSTLKKRVEEYIPEELKEKIAGEEVKDLDSLKKFLLNAEHPVVDGMARDVDGKQLTEGWKLKKVTGKIKDDVVAYIEETGGDIDLDEVADKLVLSEKQFMQVVNVLTDEGILEM